MGELTIGERCFLYGYIMPYGLKLKMPNSVRKQHTSTILEPYILPNIIEDLYQTISWKVHPKNLIQSSPNNLQRWLWFL